MLNGGSILNQKQGYLYGSFRVWRSLTGLVLCNMAHMYIRTAWAALTWVLQPDGDTRCLRPWFLSQVYFNQAFSVCITQNGMTTLGCVNGCRQCVQPRVPILRVISFTMHSRTATHVPYDRLRWEGARGSLANCLCRDRLADDDVHLSAEKHIHK